jgi:hypothetical protein
MMIDLIPFSCHHRERYGIFYITEKYPDRREQMKKRHASFLLVAGILFGLQAFYGGYLFFQLFSWMTMSHIDALLGSAVSLFASVLLIVPVISGPYCIRDWLMSRIADRDASVDDFLDQRGSILIISIVSSLCLLVFALCGGHDDIWSTDSILRLTAAVSMTGYAVCTVLAAVKVFAYHRSILKR